MSGAMIQYRLRTCSDLMYRMNREPEDPPNSQLYFTVHTASTSESPIKQYRHLLGLCLNSVAYSVFLGAVLFSCTLNEYLACHKPNTIQAFPPKLEIMSSARLCMSFFES